MLNNLRRMIKQQVKVPNANAIRRQVNRAVSEVWKKNGRYSDFWERKLQSLGKQPNIGQQIQKNIRNIRIRKNWANQKAERRFTEIREVMKNRRKQPTGGNVKRKQRTARKRPKNDVRKHHKKKERNPRPSPRPDVFPQRENRIRQPSPPTIESRNTIAKVNYNSKIGYSTSIKRLEYFTEKPQFYSDPVINVDVSSPKGDFITLKPGDSWISEWYETEILRGVDINVIGTHRLNYISNGNFEV